MIGDQPSWGKKKRI